MSDLFANKEELGAYRVINTASAFISTYWKVVENIVQIKNFRKINKICAEFYKFLVEIKLIEIAFDNIFNSDLYIKAWMPVTQDILMILLWRKRKN